MFTVLGCIGALIAFCWGYSIFNGARWKQLSAHEQAKKDAEAGLEQNFTRENYELLQGTNKQLQTCESGMLVQLLAVTILFSVSLGLMLPVLMSK